MTSRPTRRRIPVALFGLALTVCVGCAGPPRAVEYLGDGAEPDTADGLYRVRSSRMARVFLKPGVDFSAYRALRIDPVTVSYMSEGRAAGRTRQRGNQALSPEHMERFKSIFQEALEGQLGKSQYAVVAEAGPDVLRVSGHILDLVVDVPTYRGREEIDFVLKAGEMTLLLNVHDSQSGAPLARAADRRAITPVGTQLTGGYRSSPVNNWSAVRDLFDAWARTLRDGLDELRRLSPVPSPPAQRDG